MAMMSTSSFRFELPTRWVKVNSAFVERRSIVDGGWWRLLNEADAQYYFGPHLRADATNFPHLAWLASQECDRTWSLLLPRGGDRTTPVTLYRVDGGYADETPSLIVSPLPILNVNSWEIAKRFFTFCTQLETEFLTRVLNINSKFVIDNINRLVVSALLEYIEYYFRSERKRI